ncbi:MAG: hypothetical protein JWN83_44 [Chitinophagaceae bacterium]|nr:hypothetical protein [Chitinophagaceae bacterium]
MINGGTTSKYSDYLLQIFYIIFFASIICSFRAVSSIVIALILITSLVKNKTETGLFLNKNLKNSFLAGCCIFYLLQAASLLYTHDLPESIQHLRIKSGLVLIPLAVCCSNYLDPLRVKKLMQQYLWILSAAMLYCFVIALHRYYFLHTGDEVFFYHALVSPFRQNAVQVSILLFIGLIHLLGIARGDVYLHNKFVHYLLVFYLMFCILLLSSKLVIIFSAACFVYSFIISLKKNQKTLLTFSSIFICVAIALVLLMNNPVNKRFNEIISGNICLVHQQKFSPAIYFNGLQFRLLQWRFVSEILRENNAWLTGVSPGDAQTFLDNKYISTNMYVGETKNGGFLGYNTHNQFLQSVLQSGIFGLLIFIAICCSMIQLALQKKSMVLSSIVILLIAFGLNDSYLESQYGVILFTFFPLFFYYGTESKFKGRQRMEEGK